MPFVLVGDEAFPLQRHLMRPFPRRNVLANTQKIYNYRLSRARRIVENSFGILSQRFRVYNRRIYLDPPSVIAVAKATLVLHNYLTRPSDRIYQQIVEDEDGTALRRQQEITKLQRLPRRGHHPTQEAMITRRNFSRYFNGVGAVPFQNKKAHVH